ncbi:hypothetical protein [Nocardia sp. CA-120079]|uniref:hypothetical protein n=1 Tax=Nocardia sp. CA-120079 TaxID=3239974 RepID=UPI003D977CF3
MASARRDGGAGDTTSALTWSVNVADVAAGEEIWIRVLLSAWGAVRDRVAGLDDVADGYLANPFHLDELFALMRALIRRGDRPFGVTSLETRRGAGWRIEGRSR